MEKQGQQEIEHAAGRHIEQSYAGDATSSGHKKRRTPVGGHSKTAAWTVVGENKKKKNKAKKNQSGAGN